MSLGQTSEFAPRIRVASHCLNANDEITINPKFSGGDFEEATPDPIPNSEVKLFGADGTAREAVWESRTPPGFFPSKMNSPESLMRLGRFLFCILRIACAFLDGL